MRRAAVLLVGLLFISGCAVLDVRPKTGHPLVKSPASAAEAIEIAQHMARRGRWSDALAVLDSAARDFPGDRRLLEQRQALELSHQREIRVLEDQIMVGDAENQKQKIALLEKLSLAQPEDLIVVSRRIYWKEVLARRTEGLTACAEFHVGTESELAKRCFDLASTLAATPAVEQRLAQVSRQLRASEDIAAERRRANEERERQLRAKVLLGNAKVAIEAREYRRALDILDEVAGLQPNNSEVVGLQQEAWAMISPQVEALVKLGDHLYLDEQLDAAIATWQAALSLKPDDEDIVARIERATAVLSRLDALRRQQKPPGEID